MPLISNFNDYGDFRNVSADEDFVVWRRTNLVGLDHGFSFPAPWPSDHSERVWRYPPNHCHALSAVPTTQPAANATTAIPTKPKTSITRSGHRCCGSNQLMPAW
jgi:hypothetical protein